MKDPGAQFEEEVRANVARLKDDPTLRRQTIDWMSAVASAGNYTYNFRWLGRPIIQFPQDIVGFQEIVWRIQPDLIIETGIAHGGSLMLSASLLALMDLADARADASGGALVARRKVIGIDIDIRSHNHEAIQGHPLADWIHMIEGSSIDASIVQKVAALARGYERVLVCLDSNHTHDHVLCELEAYAPLVSVGSYCVVFDTLVEDLPGSFFENRPWGPGDNPKTAVRAFLAHHPEFRIDSDIEAKLQITVAPEGYLQRVSRV